MVERITKNTSDNTFVDGFVTTFFLEAKAVLDAIIVLIMSASKGKRCIFAAIPLFIFQTSITLLSGFIELIMTPIAFNNLSIVGSILTFCVGINLIWEKKIKTANLLPAIIIAVICAYIIYVTVF